jgi:hypothetical protein
MKKENNSDIIDEINVFIDEIYELIKPIDVSIDEFRKETNSIFTIKSKLIEVSLLAQKINLDTFEKKELRVVHKLIGFKKFNLDKSSNIKLIFNLVFSRELALLKINLIEIQIQKYGKTCDILRLTLQKKIIKNMRVTFKTLDYDNLF